MVKHSFTTALSRCCPGEILSPSFKQIVQDIAKSSYESRMTVTIRNFQAEDVGSYRCISKNSLGQVENSIRVYGEWSKVEDGP